MKYNYKFLASFLFVKALSLSAAAALHITVEMQRNYTPRARNYTTVCDAG